ncbi:MAG TPA: shikimate dehydrogenase [Streptosporangiaceae bacterium]
MAASAAVPAGMNVARAAVLGSPITHSLSPVLHTAGYSVLRLTGWTYEAVECDEQGLAGFLGSLGPEWAGLSLTMPLKRAVLPLLDDAEQLAIDVGAANTVLLREGRRLGYNTDVPGMVTALRQGGVTAGGGAVILGGGATACSALAALRELGASDVAVAVRSRPRAEPLCAVAARLGLDVRLIELGPDLGQTRWQLLISTVPAAGAGAVASQIKSGAVLADAVFDVLYDPWPTALAEAAGAAGLTVISGYELLVHQAVGQFELMTGRQAPVAAMRAAGLAELARRRNIR